jgi:hypothetical protein
VGFWYKDLFKHTHTHTHTHTRTHRHTQAHALKCALLFWWPVGLLLIIIIIIVIVIVLMFGSWFCLLLSLNYLTVQVTFGHLQTMQCNWLAYILYIYIHIYIYIYMIFFYLFFPNILTPGMYENDLSCWCADITEGVFWIVLWSYFEHIAESQSSVPLRNSTPFCWPAWDHLRSSLQVLVAASVWLLFSWLNVNRDS